MSDGALYNYFEDKEDLLAHALLAHVGSVMGTARPMPRPGTGTVVGNLELFIDMGLDTLIRVTPAFAGLLSQPKVLTRFRAMVGGDEAFGATGTDPAGETAGGETAGGEGAGRDAGPGDGDADEPRGLPDMRTAYLRAEQRLGRIDAAADVEAAATLLVGAMHGQILPQMLFGPPGHPVTTPPGLPARRGTERDRAALTGPGCPASGLPRDAAVEPDGVQVRRELAEGGQHPGAVAAGQP